TQAGLEAVSSRTESARTEAEEIGAALQTALAQFSEQSQQAAQTQFASLEVKLAGLFDQNLSKFSEQIASQTQAGLEAVSSRTESARTEAEEIGAALQTTLAQFSEQTREATEAQTQAFEDRLNKIAEQVLSRTQAGVEAVSGQVETARAQAAEMNAALQATLARFSEEAGTTTLSQTRAMEEKLAELLKQYLDKFSEQIASQAQAGLEAVSRSSNGNRAQTEEGQAALEAAMDRFSREAEEAARCRSQAFENRLNQMADQLARTEARLETASSRVEDGRLEPEEAKQTFEAGLERFAARSREAAQAQTRAFEDRLSTLFDENLTKFSEQLAAQAQTGMDAVASRLQDTRAQAEAMNSALELTLTRISEKKREAGQAQTEAFAENLSKIAEQLAAKSQAGFESLANGPQGARAQAEAMNSAMESALAQFGEKTREAGQAQAEVFAENLRKIAGQIMTHSQSGLESVSKRLEGARIQAEAMNSSLESTLTQFGGKIGEAARAHTDTFELSLGKIAERIEANTQAGLQSIANQVADTRVQAETVSAAVGAALTQFTQKTQDATQNQTTLFEQSLSKICRDVIAQTHQELEGLTQRVESARAQAEQTNSAVEAALKRLKQKADLAQQGRTEPDAASHSGRMANPLVRYAALGLGALALIAGVAWLGVLLSGGLGHSRLYEVPASYRGWVLVKYKNPSCPPLAGSGIYSVVQVSPSGDACTSDELPAGIQHRRFEAVEAGGARVELQDLSWDSGSQVRFLGASGSGEYELIFVGSNEELKRNWASMPKLPGIEATFSPPPAAPRSRAAQASRSSN
ncbi:MAG TPA: hypothetical protein VL523_15565, partial [Terriglobia bacterium]|nr:hypothetical protein [Terriglobia bacterium]